MQNLIEVLKEHDPIRPDFIRMAYDQEKVRSACLGPDGEELYKTEQDAVDEEMRKYFYDNWDKVIVPLLRYRFPHVANAVSLPFK